MSKGFKPWRWALPCLCAVLAVGATSVAFLSSDDAVAQSVDPQPVQPPVETVEQVPPPSTQWAHGEGERSYDSLPLAERQAHDRADEWKHLHSGHAVHQAWSRYGAIKAAEAAAIHAARAAGTEGLESVGVE